MNIYTLYKKGVYKETRDHTEILLLPIGFVVEHKDGHNPLLHLLLD